MLSRMNKIEEQHITLPKWLDDLLFNKLSAIYSRKNTNLVVLDWKQDDIRCYLGTYFPRSYSESYVIFSKYLGQNRLQYQNKEELSIFDFGCGTGGELIGFIVAVSERLSSVKKITIKALDGNACALRYLERILDAASEQTGIELNYQVMPIVIDDFYDMGIVTSTITQVYDFIISFKAVCEFVTRRQFEKRNPYEHILNELSPKLKTDGIVCLADITSFNEISQDWLPKMLDRASIANGLDIVSRNSGFNEEYHVTHSCYTNDISKIAWRIYKIRH